MDFNLAEKLAIVKAIDEVILVDGQVKKSEIDLLTQLMNILKFDRVLIEEARNITAKECMHILKGMPENKKHALGVMLNEMANADGEFNEAEYRLIFNIMLEAGIEVDHNPD
ncbi:TerB family tellurite resistance protein [Eudoraea chungangensis]|uniref:TerB family tellurite resistance protein n=1 Tax=Eudoraea chungangensis TaxID=1481905 RepID=UPI0023EE0430|nr:TerB family tellurite resistance protein [Eudoraea chungangensis]